MMDGASSAAAAAALEAHGFLDLQFAAGEGFAARGGGVELSATGIHGLAGVWLIRCHGG